jgi:hypothetical protein
LYCPFGISIDRWGRFFPTAASAGGDLAYTSPAGKLR